MLACVNPLRSQAFISCLITDEGGRGKMGSGVRNVVFLTDKKQANIAELAQFILTLQASLKDDIYCCYICLKSVSIYNVQQCIQ